MADKTNKPETKTPAPKKKAAPKKAAQPIGLWAKIMNVQQKAQVVAKLGFNDFHKYKYAYERDHIAEIKPLLGAEGLVLYPTTVSLQKDVVQTSKGATEYQVTVGVRYTIRDVETGQGHSVVFNGTGQDATDKALPKAYTMANKYFLQKFFMLETSDDDAENEKGGKDAAKNNAPEETTAVKFEKAKALIQNINDSAKLFEVLEGIKESKIYNQAQKAELNKIISSKIDEIDNHKTT